MMNAAAFLMQNGTPCLIYDGAIPPIRELQFCKDDHLITLVWTNPQTGGDEHMKMEYPLSEHILGNLLRLGIAAIGRLSQDRKVEDLHIARVVYTDELGQKMA